MLMTKKSFHGPPRPGRRPIRGIRRSKKRVRTPAPYWTVMSNVTKAQTADQAIRAALDAIRAAFGWSYGSYWVLDPASTPSGSAWNPEP